MKVRMLIDIDGPIDGRPWPRKGGTIDLADHVAADLISNRYAEALDEVETAVVNPVAETATKPAPRARRTTPSE